MKKFLLTYEFTKKLLHVLKITFTGFKVGPLGFRLAKNVSK